MAKQILNSKELIEQVVEAIQDKKGKNIVIADMTGLGNTICDYFVIWEGLIDKFGHKPFAVDGQRNSQWVAMDYGEVFVHIFLPDVRAFYDIEHLWADAKLQYIPDLD